MNVCMYCSQSMLNFGAIARETGTESGITNRVTITTVLLLPGVTPPQPEKRALFFLAPLKNSYDPFL